MRKIFLAFFTLFISVTSFAQIGPIVAPDSICVGDMPTLFCSPPGGAWTSSDTLVATIDSTSGVATGIGPGVVTITYSATGATTTFTLTVNPVPSAITCPLSGCSICVGDSATVTDGMPGGTWSSSLPGVATIDPITGVVNGISSGTTILTYMLPTGCYVVSPFTVNAPPAIFAITTTGTSYCAGGAGVFIGLSSSQLGASYQLYCGSTPVGTPVTGTGAAISFGLQTGGCTYTVIASFPSTGCTSSMTGSFTLTINPVPVAITCPLTGCNVCAGSSIILTDATIGGTWNSGSPGTASVNPATGVVTGVSSGIATITYTLPGGCFVTNPVTVNPSPGLISGIASLCIGANSTLSCSPGGGTWSSSDMTVVTIGSVSGTATGVAVGTATITYTLPAGCMSVMAVTVTPTPTAIAGTSTVCVGSTTTLTDGVPGGVWSSSNTSIATIGSFSGLVTGVSTGPATITYQLSSGCYVTQLMTVISSPAPIGGPGNTVCVLGTIILTDADTGGMWSSSNPSVASVGASSGVVTGVTVGVVTITYSFGGGCLTTTLVSVNAIPAPVSGPNSVCLGYTIPLSDATSGGVWSSAGTYATVDTSGNVTGVAAGMETITYTLSTGCFTTYNVTVDPAPCTPALGVSATKVIASNVEIFPNPVPDELTIKTNEGAYNSFSITNSIGQVLMQQNLTGKETTLNVRSLPTAIYYVTLRGENGVVVKRFVKQ